MNNDSTQQLSSQGNTGKDEHCGLLAAASDFARSVLESVQALAGTTTCKGVQIARLKDWAISNHCWIDRTTLGTFSDRGSENEVYASLDSRYVYKLNDFRYSDDNLNPFFERIHIHNQLFPDCAYEFIGFAENRDGKTCAVLRQPFIQAQREAIARTPSRPTKRLPTGCPATKAPWASSIWTSPAWTKVPATPPRSSTTPVA